MSPAYFLYCSMAVFLVIASFCMLDTCGLIRHGTRRGGTP